MQKFLTLALASALTVAPLAAQAQSAPAQATGTVTGTATSNTGRRLPGITIQVRNAEGAIVGSTVTGNDGTFMVPGLAAGAYTLECLSESKSVIGTERVTLTPPSVEETLTCAFDAGAFPLLNKKVLTALGAAAIAIGAVAVVSTRGDGSPAR